MSITMRNELATPTLSALTADAATPVEWHENDAKMVLVVQNDGEDPAELTVLAGNGIQGVCDQTLTVPVGISLLKLESGRFKNVSGTNKGKIVVKSPTALKIGAAALV